MPDSENPISVYLHISRRGHYWRVAVIFADRILWRTYSHKKYPDPESVAVRCMEKLQLVYEIRDPGHQSVIAFRVQWWEWL